MIKTLTCSTLLGLLLTVPSLTTAGPDLAAGSSDINKDGLVDRADLAVMKSAFFSDDKRADLNGDGRVNFGDLALLRAAFDGGAQKHTIRGDILPSISLIPANQTVEPAQSFTLEVWMDFTAEATLGGGFNVNYNPDVFAFADWAPEDLGDPGFLRLPDTDVPGVLSGFGFGEFNGLTGPALVGTLTFQPLQAAKLDITPSEGSPIVGPFVSSITFMSMTVDYIPANIHVTGVPLPIIGVTPETLEFPPAQLFEEKTLNVLVSNEGELDLSIGQIATVDTITDPFAIITDECSGTALAPMNSCELTVNFIPTEEGVAMDSFDVPSDDPIRPGVIVSVSGEGLPPAAPAIDVQPGSVDFGPERLGQTASTGITISNLGAADLVLGQVGSLDPPFSIVSEACSSATLAPSDSCIITAEFTPTELGEVSDSFELPSNDPNAPIVTVDVTGRGQTVGLLVNDAWVRTARCRNLNSGERLDFGVGGITIDCEEAGLTVSSGDQVSIVASGTATGSDVGALHTGLKDQVVLVQCRNTTTTEKITFATRDFAFNCVNRGLAIQPEDGVVLIVRGIAL